MIYPDRSIHPSIHPSIHWWSRSSSWWLNQPIWKICSSNWIISPGVKIPKIFELPPPSHSYSFYKLSRKKFSTSKTPINFTRRNKVGPLLRGINGMNNSYQVGLMTPVTRFFKSNFEPIFWGPPCTKTKVPRNQRHWEGSLVGGKGPLPKKISQYPSCYNHASGKNGFLQDELPECHSKWM